MGGRHPLWTALAATICAAALGACGSSGGPATTVSSGRASALELANCMRSHGVPNFPDPSPGGGLQIAPGSGVNPEAPSFQAAKRACARFLPNGGAPPATSESQRLAALAFAKCMRTHGQPGFPDPALTPPTGAARVLVLRGMVFAIGPGTDPKSPAFRHAASACGVSPPGG